VAVAHGAVAVFEYHLIGPRRIWHSILFTSLAIPILFFLGVGIAVGAYVDRSRALGMPYLQFVGPAMLASTGLQLAVLEASFPVLASFRFQRIYFIMAATPLRVIDMLLGRLGFIALRVLVAVTAFLVVMLPFGVVRSWWALLTPAVAVLVAMAAAGPVFAYAASVKSPNQMGVLTGLLVLPVTLTGGVFFPIDRLNVALQPLAYVLPLWHGSELCRAAALGTAPTWPVAAHVAVLLAWVVGGILLARWRFARRLAI
jgi:lipooligosaccharide transport system permease protein